MAQQTEQTPTPCPYFGGKATFAKLIVPLIQQIEHEAYLEPFVGMGGVFFRRPERARIEIINDGSTDVANLFRVIQHHDQELIRLVSALPVSREVYDRHRGTDPATLTDIQRAARFVYLQFCSYGALPRGRSFRTMRRVRPALRQSSVQARFEKLAARLDGVVVESLSALDFVKRYDRDGGLFYIDPPYFGHPSTYLATFDATDHAQLADALEGIKGRFLLSIDDCQAAREVYGRFRIVEVSAPYSMTRGRSVTIGKELVITNARLAGSG